jgi:hypothetical protein
MSDSMQAVMTPTVRTAARRAAFWVVLVTVVVLIAAVSAAVGGVGQSAEPMSARSAAPAGAKALVEVLRHEGVTVVVVDSLAEAEEAVRDPSATTLFLYDFYYYLDPQQTARAMGLADTVVVLQPSYDALQQVSPDLALAGYIEGTRDAECSVDAAVAAESITTSGDGYRILDDAENAEGCFGDDDVYSLVQVGGATALGATTALTNGEILSEGNAALGLRLLGSQPTLVWYLPTLADDADAPLTVDELSPEWVQPVTLTAFLVGIAAIAWRGRRFGPLIVENLPVTVKASETMHGRARLYERANARLHTLDSLRIGTIARLAALCGLPALATVDEVVAASAAITGRDPRLVRDLLVDAQPQGDRDLLRLSDELLVFEQSVATSLRPH